MVLGNARTSREATRPMIAIRNWSFSTVRLVHAKKKAPKPSLTTKYVVRPLARSEFDPGRTREYAGAAVSNEFEHSGGMHPEPNKCFVTEGFGVRFPPLLVEVRSP